MRRARSLIGLYRGTWPEGRPAAASGLTPAAIRRADEVLGELANAGVRLSVDRSGRLRPTFAWKPSGETLVTIERFADLLAARLRSRE